MPLILTTQASCLYDEKEKRFIDVKETKLQLEHSLVSISKWEAKWKKSFISTDNKTPEEWIDYFRCMTITQNVNPYVYSILTEDNISTIRDYIEDPMTATTFTDNKKSFSRSIITSEQIYCLMLQYNIPIEFQKWHLNRLTTLIRVCRIKMEGSSKLSKKESAERYRQLNEERKAKLHTRG